MNDKCPTFDAGRSLRLAAAAFVLTWSALIGTASAAGQTGGGVVTVNLSLTKYSAVEKIDAGSMAGVRPGVVHVRVGDRVVFVNDDSDHHTATALVNAVSFVDDPRWTDDALHASGEIGPRFWSTGDLAPGQKSAALVARKAGTYLFGCFFDYGAGMRGEIVVEP
jgi:plastocyanin